MSNREINPEETESEWSENSSNGEELSSGPCSTEADSDYETAKELSTETTSEYDSNGESEGENDQDAETDSSSEDDNGGDQQTRRYPDRQRSQPRRLTDFTAACHGEVTEIPATRTCHNAPSVNTDSPILKEAITSTEKEVWLQAINEELISLAGAGTCEMVSPPAGERIFPSKFVLKRKRDSSGIIERYKARLVLLGHLQRQNIDFFETYAPVVDFTAVRVALVIACYMKMEIHQLDVKCAFLNGTIDEEIYMRLPDQFEDKSGKVCRLRRSIYGLRQAPRAWNERLTTDLKKIDCKEFQHTESLYCKETNGVKVYLLIYIDDILVMVSSAKHFKAVKDEISKLYTVKDLGKAEYFLGIKLEQTSDGGMKLSQTQYVTSILETFGMSSCKPVSTPMVQNTDLMKRGKLDDEESMKMRGIPYREAIGSLMYLSVRTRPDILVSVGILAKHVQNPRPLHWEAVKRSFRYLKGTVNDGLIISGKTTKLNVFVDADWGTDPEDRCSRTGVVGKLGDDTVWWKSRKQVAVALSSCEAEYMALFEGAKDTIWLRNLLCEFGMCQGNIPTMIHHDNQGSIAWVEDGSLRKVKHIDLRYKYTTAG